MNRYILPIAGSVLISAAGLLQARDMSSTSFPAHAIPVLVQVSSQGKVVNATPAVTLEPHIDRLLRANLDEMITAPARDKHGKPIGSQFVANMALQAEPDAAGNIHGRFVSNSVAPVPPGDWYWVHGDGDRLALARRGEPAGHTTIQHTDMLRAPATRNLAPATLPSFNSPTPAPAAATPAPAAPRR